MNSLELINELYKPYRITKQGRTTIIDSMEGKFVIKKKGTKDIKELFCYLKSRDFNYMPKIVDATRNDINIYEYIEDTHYPKDQKAVDLIKVVTNLHNRTSYHKEVREDKYKEIYENIQNNLQYYKNEYQKMVLDIEEHVFMSPSEYLFIRNSSKLLNQIEFCENKLDEWYSLVKDKRETRISIVHNNLSLDHFIKGKEEVLISWEQSIEDSPILDIYNFYQKEALNLEFGNILKEYFKNSNISDDEKKLLFILLCMPQDIKFKDNEFESCKSISKALDYVFKTEYLVRPYYLEEDKK